MTKVSRRFAVVGGILAVIGTFAVVVGSHDVFAAHGLGSRLFGALLAAAGLIMLVAAAGVVRRSAWHVAASMVGSFAALLVGIALLIAQWEADGSSATVLVWLAVVVASLIAFLLSVGQGAPKVSQAVRRVQLVAVVGMAIGVAQFVFTTVYGPGVAGPHLTLTSTLERVGEKDGVMAVKARVTVENTGDQKIVLVDSLYRVAGQKTVAEAQQDDEKPFPFLKELGRAAASPRPVRDTVAASRWMDESGGAVVNAGQLIERGFWFEPGESTAREFVVHVPSGRYDLLRLGAELTVADHDVLDLSDEPTSGPKVSRYRENQSFMVAETQWSIDETSWVRRIIRGDNVLWSRWLLAGPGDGLLPIMLAYVDGQGQTYDPWGEVMPDRVVQLSADYSVITTYTYAELSLFPPAAEAG